MILPDFILPSRINQQWEYSGIDSPEKCLDKLHFARYPHKITYNYNSRGFRDQEWPSDHELQQAIWCIGDSFTVGVGNLLEHTWPYLLEQHTGQRTINVSMDGASNNWIARKAFQVQRLLRPKYIVVQWSYLHRRELDFVTTMEKLWPIFYNQVRDPSWPETAEFAQLSTKIQIELTVLHNWPGLISDEERMVQYLKTTVDEDIDDTIACINYLGNDVIHTFIPNFIDTNNQNKFYAQLDQTGIVYIKDFKRLDLARDGHHYDIKTSEFFIQQILQVLN